MIAKEGQPVTGSPKSISWIIRKTMLKIAIVYKNK
jgi:hypothetical protein